METNYFGLYLAKIRRKNRLKQKEVAFDAGMDPSYIAALENGRRLPPKQSLMVALTKAVQANEVEQRELSRAANLSEMAKGMEAHREEFLGVPVAMAILELSAVMTQAEIDAIATLVAGYRYRAYVQGGREM